LIAVEAIELESTWPTRSRDLSAFLTRLMVSIKTTA